MATHTVTSAKHATLTAATEDIINVTEAGGTCIITNRGGGTIYARLDGVAPTVAGDNTFVIPAGTSKVFEREEHETNVSQVRLISATADAYSVEVI